MPTADACHADRGLVNLYQAAKGLQHLLTPLAVRTSPFSDDENSKEKCIDTKKMNGDTAYTAPSVLFAKKTNSFFVGTTAIQMQVSSVSLNIFALSSPF